MAPSLLKLSIIITSMQIYSVIKHTHCGTINQIARTMLNLSNNTHNTAHRYSWHQWWPLWGFGSERPHHLYQSHSVCVWWLIVHYHVIVSTWFELFVWWYCIVCDYIICLCYVHSMFDRFNKDRATSIHGFRSYDMLWDIFHQWLIVSTMIDHIYSCFVYFNILCFIFIPLIDNFNNDWAISIHVLIISTRIELLYVNVLTSTKIEQHHISTICGAWMCYALLMIERYLMVVVLSSHLSLSVMFMFLIILCLLSMWF